MKLSRCFALASLALAFTLAATSVSAESVLKMVPRGPLKILDPSITTAYITRDHAYLVYDTLFAVDGDGAIQPQMVDSYEVDAEQKNWTFRLREGLAFHNGKPVTSADVIASLKRWGARDTLGRKLIEFTDTFEAIDDRSFAIHLKKPFGLMLEALGKPSAIVPFIMPKAVIEVAGDKPITDIVGSGPYIFQEEEFRPGDRAVYVKNPDYKPRAEPASGNAGGKVAKLDRIEWKFLRDAQTAVNALKNGEIDYIDQLDVRQVAALEKDAGVEVLRKPNDVVYVLRFNHLIPPFDNPKIRRAAMLAVNQEAILRVQVGVPDAFSRCTSVYPCGSTYASDETGFFDGRAHFEEAKKLLKEAGYDNTPIVLLNAPEIPAVAKLGPVMSALLKQAGFKTELVQLDWAGWLQRRTNKGPVDQGGWNMFFAGWSPYDLTVPIASAPLTANGDKGWPGWFQDDEIAALLDNFTNEPELEGRKQIAAKIQLRALEQGAIAPMGESDSFAAARKGSLTGWVDGVSFTPFWNVSKLD